MPESVNESLQNSAISHAVYLERYKASVIRDMMKLLNLADQDIVDKLSKMDGETRTKAYLEEKLKAIRAINVEAMAKFQEKVQLEFKDFAEYEANYQAETIQKTIPIDWTVTQPAPDQLYAAVTSKPFENALLKNHLAGIEKRRIDLIDGAIRQGWVQGETIAEITRRIRGSRKLRYKDGILEKSRQEIASLVRTALNHTANESRNALYDANDDLIKGVQYVATLDGSTTLICATLDSQVFEINKGPRPPQHWGCRSTTVPVVKSWKELGIDLEEAPEGTRASMNGQVPAKTKFEAWLKKQDEATQLQVLGVGRFELWKKGVPLGRFVSNGKVLTLRQLAELEGIAIPGKKPASKTTSDMVVVPAFKKHTEASAWAIKNGVAEYSSFKGVPPEIARDWIQGAVDVQARVPGMQMDFIGSAQERNRFAKDMLRPKAELRAAQFYEPGTPEFENFVIRILNRSVPRMEKNAVAVSFWSPPLRGIAVNTKFAKSYEAFSEMVKRNMDSGWWSKGDKASVAHIVAHEMAHEIDRKYGIRRDPRIIALFKDNDIRSVLSHYGSHSVGEMVAEAWAEYTNSKNPRPISKSIGEIMEEIISGSGKSTQANNG